MQHGKVKNNTPKLVQEYDAHLEATILLTMQRISAIVGATLGPGGRPVMLERQETGLPPMLTKDGVTVMKSLGFTDAIQDGIMELARDASIRTANEAGDGTTTAAVLAEAVVRYTHRYCHENPKVSPQLVVRSLMKVFREVIEPAIQNATVAVDPSSEEGKELLRAVATVSANGDTELADAVMQCLDLIGDDGNVTIVESSGPSEYRANRIAGYPILTGYEESARKFYPEFINDRSNMRTLLQTPHFLIYHGNVTSTSTILPALSVIGKAWEAKLEARRKNEESDVPLQSPNIVLVATGFSDQVLGDLAANFRAPDTLNVVPVLTPRNAMMHGQHDLLLDLAAVTGAVVFDPMSKPLDSLVPTDVGPGVFILDEEGQLKPGSIEVYRFRTTVVGQAAVLAPAFERKLTERVAQVQTQAKSPESQLDGFLLRERLAKLTSGIAQLIVSGASNGELKERRDRAEDAVCAVTGSIKHGCLPGACWGLMHVYHALDNYMASCPINIGVLVEKIMLPALRVPLDRLLKNAGLASDEADSVVAQMIDNQLDEGSEAGTLYNVFDAREQRWVQAFQGGLLDSTPAVLEAIRNAMSIALILGTLGGAVMFPRDAELERRDAAETLEFLRNANVNEADDRP